MLTRAMLLTLSEDVLQRIYNDFVNACINECERTRAQMSKVVNGETPVTCELLLSFAESGKKIRQSEMAAHRLEALLKALLCPPERLLDAEIPGDEPRCTCPTCQMSR